MVESHEILVKSLCRYGVSVPPRVSSVRELSSNDLLSICSQCLKLIDHTKLFPLSLSSGSVSDRAKICSEIASTVKNLGYVGDLSFHKFMYPSEEDSYKLIIFLVEKLSDSRQSFKAADSIIPIEKRKLTERAFEYSLDGSTEMTPNNKVDPAYPEIVPKLEDHILLTERTSSLISGAQHGLINQAKEHFSISETNYRKGIFRKGELTCLSNRDNTEAVGSERYVICNKDTIVQAPEKMKSKEKSLVMEVDIQTSELQHLEHELQLLKAATDMAFHDQQSIDFCLDSLNVQLDAKRECIIKLESDWEVNRKHIEGKKGSLEETLYGNNPLAREMLKKLQEVELERQSALVEIRRREEEHARLSVDLQKQQKFTSRKSHIQRIQEITKNSRKQEADIDRIVKETRELQLEINSISERLDRTYALADDMVFREAKKDFTGRKAHRLLNSIHEGFEQISDNILATDRIRKEMAELEMRLAAMASASVNLDKLVADVDSIVRENGYLEQES